MEVSAGVVQDLGGEEIGGLSVTVTGRPVPGVIVLDLVGGKGNHRENFLAGGGADSPVPVLVELRDDIESALVWRCKADATGRRGEGIGAMEGRDDGEGKYECRDDCDGEDRGIGKPKLCV